MTKENFVKYIESNIKDKEVKVLTEQDSVIIKKWKQSSRFVRTNNIEYNDRLQEMGMLFVKSFNQMLKDC